MVSQCVRVLGGNRAKRLETQINNDIVDVDDRDTDRDEEIYFRNWPTQTWRPRSKLEIEESWWCNSFWVQRLESGGQGVRLGLSLRANV